MPHVSRPKRVESVFLNIPYDTGFEDLYLAYIVGLTTAWFAHQRDTSRTKSGQAWMRSSV